MKNIFIITAAALLLGCGSIPEATDEGIISGSKLEDVKAQHRLFLMKEADYAKRDVQIPRYEDLGVQLPNSFGPLPPTSIWWARDREKNVKFPERYYWNFFFDADVVLLGQMHEKLNCEIVEFDKDISACRPKPGHHLNLEFWTGYDPASGPSETRVNYVYRKRDK